MSTAGSGNQGITALMPLIVAHESGEYTKDQIIEGAFLSHLLTKYVRDQSGHLSALCGCAIKAGIGATAGLTYVLGGNEEQINNSINHFSF